MIFIEKIKHVGVIQTRARDSFAYFYYVSLTGDTFRKFSPSQYIFIFLHNHNSF